MSDAVTPPYWSRSQGAALVDWVHSARNRVDQGEQPATSTEPHGFSVDRQPSGAGQHAKTRS